MAESAVKRGVKDKDIIKEMLDKKDLKGLAKQMRVDVVHSSDIDTTEPKDEKIFDGKFVNTWCIPSYMEEYDTPSEVSLGTADSKTFSAPPFSINKETDPPSVILPINQYLKSGQTDTTQTSRSSPPQPRQPYPRYTPSPPHCALPVR